MRVEGIIACLSQETTDFSHISALKDINMPLILFDRVCPTDQFSSVIADGAQSAQMATQHLLDNGSKRVAFIGGANHLDIVKRRKHGYLEALRENRILIEKELVVCRKIDYEEGKIATETLLSLPQPPDAILAMNDTLAFAAMEVIKTMASAYRMMWQSSGIQTSSMLIMWNRNYLLYHIKLIKWEKLPANYLSIR